MKDQYRTPLHYVVFHPTRTEYETRGETASQDGRKTHWQGSAWCDRVAMGNQDPYVWHMPWVYSYCHAISLPHTRPESRIDKDSIIFFCETGAARNRLLVIDTVFVVAQRLEWLQVGHQVPSIFSDLQGDANHLLWKEHLSHGIRQPKEKGHKGTVSYLASHAGTRFSFLPMSGGRPIEIDPLPLLGACESDIVLGGVTSHGTYPRPLSPLAADTLYQALQAVAEERLVKLDPGMRNRVRARPSTR